VDLHLVHEVTSPQAFDGLRLAGRRVRRPDRTLATADHNVPTGTNTVNFTPQAAFGAHILGAKYNVSLEVRYLHISNAGLATPNPGINTVQVRLGVGRFFSGKKP